MVCLRGVSSPNPMNMTTFETTPVKLEFSVDLDRMELRINDSQIRIKYYEGLGWAPVISEKEREKY